MAEIVYGASPHIRVWTPFPLLSTVLIVLIKVMFHQKKKKGEKAPPSGFQVGNDVQDYEIAKKTSNQLSLLILVLFQSLVYVSYQIVLLFTGIGRSYSRGDSAD